MPFKSQAQRRKFYQLLEEGKIDRKIVEEFERESQGMHLPERVNIKKPKKPKKP